MLKKIKELITQQKEFMDAMYECQKENKALQKQGKDLLKQINTAKKQGAVLLLEDITEDLIKKLQEITEDNVIVFFLKDGTRMEVRKESTNYKRDRGEIR